MPKINFNQAREWLENISEKDSVAIIHHDDGDGFASGILFYDWCKLKDAKVNEFTFNLGESSLKDYALEEFNKIIITDIAPFYINKELLENIDKLKEKEVFYTDHHIAEGNAPEETLEYRTTEEGYIPSSRTAGELTGLKHWLSVAGTVCDAGELYAENEEFIDKFLNEINWTLEDFKEKVTSKITNFIVYLKETPEKIFEILESISSLEEINKIYEYSEIIEEELEKIINEYESKKERLGDVNFYYFESKYRITKPVAQIISRGTKEREKNGESYIFASLSDDKSKIKLSARCQNQKRDMNQLIKEGIRGLSEANGGGHFAAAGGQIKTEDIDKFKENIRNYIQNLRH